MSASSEKPAFADATKIGDHAAQQPLSGVDVVTMGAVNNGHGSFVHSNTEAKPETSAA